MAYLNDAPRPMGIRKLRAIVRELDLNQINEFESNFAKVVGERKEYLEQQAEQQVARQAKIEEYRDLLVRDGITIEELTGYLAKPEPIGKAKKPPRPAKYEYINGHGLKQSWTGQGRTPSVIQSAIDNGGNLEDFAI